MLAYTFALFYKFVYLLGQDVVVDPEVPLHALHRVVAADRQMRLLLPLYLVLQASTYLYELFLVEVGVCLLIQWFRVLFALLGGPGGVLPSWVAADALTIFRRPARLGGASVDLVDAGASELADDGDPAFLVRFVLAVDEEPVLH